MWAVRVGFSSTRSNELNYLPGVSINVLILIRGCDLGHTGIGTVLTCPSGLFTYKDCNVGEGTFCLSTTAPIRDTERTSTKVNSGSREEEVRR